MLYCRNGPSIQLLRMLWVWLAAAHTIRDDDADMHRAHSSIGLVASAVLGVLVRFRDDEMMKLATWGAGVPLIASNGQRIGAL